MKRYFKENFYKITGYPTDFKAKKKGLPMSGNMAQSKGTTITCTSLPVFTQDQYNQILNMPSKTTIGDTSGRSAHMEGILLCEHKLKISHVGSCQSDVIIDVLCVPDYKFNLLSVS